MNLADERRIEMLWTVLQIGSLALPLVGLAGSMHPYWRSVPRVRLDRKRILELMPASSLSAVTYSVMQQAVVQCLN
jgi:hypothetical protein